jgi:hypothetical protein
MRKTTEKKLTLRTETLHTLVGPELNNVVGGIGRDGAPPMVNNTLAVPTQKYEVRNTLATPTQKYEVQDTLYRGPSPFTRTAASPSPSPATPAR